MSSVTETRVQPQRLSAIFLHLLYTMSNVYVLFSRGDKTIS